ncbi:type III restriction endonuclease subunit R [Henriciella barbarensis]|uniref:Type III restriction endonuclease subunit R n=1 Tax=Henriciella barbarensis TaxID=86342 RepID=A0A399R0Z6_9PROT|nr:DEAD/DEAH box helicase family protein [Henriciella barbarensis]RIJ23965.1 type III restriction endonuclease subunit R [Henriciella barbarensis]
MKFTLKDYQEDAVADVLVNLRKARKRWHEDRDKQAFSLTATTGAGKTVMAAAVIEALFHGSADFEFEPDRGAVVIWFSDDPSLNEQSKYRLMEASDKLTVSDLVTVESSFGRERFEPGKVYFLNTQKLSKNSLLVRGHDDDEDAIVTDDGRRLLPDARSHTIWDTIQNTIEDPDLTLYLVLDEAHRGMRGTASGRQTIVTRLIGGQGRVPGIPIVWGISATVERFDTAIRDIPGLSTLPNVVVDSKKVQDSGLLKDTINLDVPEETGDFSTVLLRRGTAKLREISKAWADYAKLQDVHKPVQPLMVLQVPNNPDHDEIGLWLQTIFQEWPEIVPSSIANVFGEHRNESFGPYAAPYIAPERVQDADWVRILIAKDAISTGWDCPRAEVMVSFRAASDETHITQLLGRMVRTPMARRIPGNELLNSVACLLPHFNRKTVERVVDLLINGGELGGDGTGRRVLINPVEMLPNPDVPEAVWEKLEALPSQSLPKRQAKPVKRLTILAHRLAVDGLLADAGKEAHRRMHKVLDGLAVTYSDEIREARESVLQVEGATLVADVHTQKRSFNDFVEDADFAVIEDAYRRAGRAISPDLAKTYSEHLAAKNEDAEDDEDALIEAHTDVAALGLVPDIKDKLDAAADELAKQWLTQHRVAIKSLKDDRQEAYRDIRAMSTDPLDIDLVRPKVWQQQTRAKNPDGQTVDLPRYEKHLICDSDGMFPDDLNPDEIAVLKAEMKRPGFKAWYRNPPGTSQESLGISYELDGAIKIVRPDFICFSEIADGTIVADVVDPHGTHLSDALPKLQGLANYAAKHSGVYRRIDSIAKMPSGQFKVLDMTEPSVREAVLKASSAAAVFESAAATHFTS